MNIQLVPINDDNREAVLKLSTREDQPFCAPNDYSLQQAEECNEEQPGVARPLPFMRMISRWAYVCLLLIRRKKIRMIDIGSGAL